MTSQKLPLLASAAGLALLVGPAGAALYVYEGFQYGPAGTSQVDDDTDPNYNLLHTQPDGVGSDTDATGLSGTWQDSSGPGAATDLFINSGSLSFGDLATSGNHVRTDTNNNNDVFSRSTVALDGGSELWFSVLANKVQNNFSAAEGGLVIGNQAVNNPRVLNDDGTTGLAGFGVAPTTSGNNWTPYAWNGTSQSLGDAVYGVPTNGSETNLLVGKVFFGTGTGGADQYTLYYYDLTAAGGAVVDNISNLVAIASTIEVDVDESTLDTLSLTRQVNTAWDEIRIGSSFADVIPVSSGGTSFADWIAGFSVGGDTGFDQDPDGDGIDSGVEAFFGTAPDSPNAGLTEVAESGGDLTFTHPEADPQLTDVSGSYEWSLDLSAWNDSGDEVSGTTVTIGTEQNTPESGTTTVTADVTGTAPGKVFVRAVATQG